MKTQSGISYNIKALRANDAHSHERKTLLRNRARRGKKRCAISIIDRVNVRSTLFLLQ